MTVMLSSLIDKKGFLKQMNKKAKTALEGAATLKAQLNNSKSKRKQ